jgi:hypothetical protein
MSRRSPTLVTVTIPTANTNVVLLTLLQALDPQILRRAQSIQLQLDVNAGAANLFIGNPGMTATNFGVQLVASQAFSIPSLDSNLILLDDIVLRTDGTNVKVNVALITR